MACNSWYRLACYLGPFVITDYFIFSTHSAIGIYYLRQLLAADRNIAQCFNIRWFGIRPYPTFVELPQSRAIRHFGALPNFSLLYIHQTIANPPCRSLLAQDFRGNTSHFNCWIFFANLPCRLASNSIGPPRSIFLRCGTE